MKSSSESESRAEESLRERLEQLQKMGGESQSSQSSHSEIGILVADDDLLTRTALRIQLDYLGYHVDCAKDGQEALAAIAQKDYRLLIIDMHMGATDGLSMTLAIREAVPADKQPFIAILTGGVTNAELEALQKAGIDYYLEKPVSIYNLEKLLESAFPGVSQPALTLPEAEVQNTPPKTQPCGIDFQILHELLNLNRQRIGNLTENFLDLFFQTAPGLMQKIKETSQNRQFMELKGYLHALRGSCEIYGANRLTQLCKTLEKEIEQKAAENISEQIDGIEAEYLQVSAILRAYQSSGMKKP